VIRYDLKTLRLVEDMLRIRDYGGQRLRLQTLGSKLLDLPSIAKGVLFVEQLVYVFNNRVRAIGN